MNKVFDRLKTNNVVLNFEKSSFMCKKFNIQDVQFWKLVFALIFQDYQNSKNYRFLKHNNKF